jgi:hypothetical protein
VKIPSKETPSIAAGLGRSEAIARHRDKGRHAYDISQYDVQVVLLTEVTDEPLDHHNMETKEPLLPCRREA